MHSRTLHWQPLLAFCVLCVSLFPPQGTFAAPIHYSTYPATLPSYIGSPTSYSVLDDGKGIIISAANTGAIVSADGASISTLTFNPPLTNVSSRAMVMSGSTMFLAMSAGGTGRIERRELSGTIATFVASGSISSGVVSLVKAVDGRLYLSRSNTLSVVNTADMSIASTVSLIQTPNAMVASPDGYIYYVSTTGTLRKVDPSLGSATEATVTSTNHGVGCRIAMDTGGNIYVLRKNATLLKYTPGGTLLWTYSSAGGSRVGTGAIVVKNGIIYSADVTRVINRFLPINAVSTFTATPSGFNMDLSWNSGVVDSDFNGVVIRRSTSLFPSTVTDGQYVTLYNTGSSLTDAGLSDNTTYYYSIFNENKGGEYSTIATASATISAPPDAPSPFTAAGTGSTAHLSWTNPAGDFDSVTLKRSTTGYPADVSEGTTVFANQTYISYTDAALPDGQYYYSLFAKDYDGNYSAAATATLTIDTTAPSTPVLSAVASGDTVNLTWDVPSGTDTFTVRWSTVSAPNTSSTGTLLLSTGSTVTSHSHTGLSNGTYYYSVFAQDAYGNISNAGTASATVAVSSSSSASSEAARQSSGGSRGKQGTDTIIRLLQERAKAISSLAPKTVTPLKTARICGRVKKWVGTDNQRMQQMNVKLQKEFGFTCQ